MKPFLYNLYLALAERISFLVPVCRRRVVFCSCGGNAFGGDPSFVAQALSQKRNDVELIWATKHSNVQLPIGIMKWIIFNPQKSLIGQLWIAMRTFYLFASARVLVFDNKGNRFHKNRKALYIQTWHGDFPFKLIEGECEHELPGDYLENSKKESKDIDVIISASSMMSNIFKKRFWLRDDCIITEFGITRNDEYINGNCNRVKKVRDLINVDENVHLAVYAPTFRDDGDVSVYAKLDFAQLKQSLENRFGGSWKVLVRLHPNVSSSSFDVLFCKDVINVTNVADGVGVFLASDLAITDASSIVRDFIAMKKPIFSYFPDFDHYVLQCRSLRSLFYRLPFKRCTTTEELVTEIKTYDQVQYNAKMNAFLKAEGVTFFDTGNATENICNIIIRYIESGKIVLPGHAYRLVSDPAV